MFPLLSGKGLFYISFWEVLLPVLFTNTTFFLIALEKDPLNGLAVVMMVVGNRSQTRLPF